MIAEDGALIAEGVFRITDTFQWYTPIFVSCELSSRYISLTLFDEVQTNLSSPHNIFLNVIRNQFNLFSDLSVIMADLVYSEYYSMAFWIGDIVYNLIVE